MLLALGALRVQRSPHGLCCLQQQVSIDSRWQQAEQAGDCCWLVAGGKQEWAFLAIPRGSAQVDAQSVMSHVEFVCTQNCAPAVAEGLQKKTKMRRSMK